MLFPVSGVEVSPFLLIGISFVISFFASMSGLSGAFLLLPFQVSFLGFVSPAVTPTNLLYNVVSIPGGVYRYVKEARMVWPLTIAVIIGTFPGLFIGTFLRLRYFMDPVKFKIFVGLVLLYIGIRMVLNARKTQVKRLTGEAKVRTIKFDTKEIVYTFNGKTYRASTPGIFILSFIVGIIGGIYGIGGGAIIAPFFVAIYRLPIHTIAGSTLMGTFLTSVAGVIIYQILSIFYPGAPVAPDWALGIVMGVGGIFGVYLGARSQKYIPSKYLKIMLSIVILYVAIKYVWLLF
ncbi:MAG: sulfite exporter TauE/SafE family protein [Nanoarchaeota archaeon]|nr:sulfite exporter TauE/SafE family protein [Nanoarchaeota archaeon]